MRTYCSKSVVEGSDSLKFHSLLTFVPPSIFILASLLCWFLFDKACPVIIIALIPGRCPPQEHSSFDDLRACVAALKPRKIIPTVNADTK